MPSTIIDLIKRFTATARLRAPLSANLTGSSAAAVFAMRPEPLLALEHCEEAAIRLYEDIRFYRALYNLSQLSKLPDILFVPAEDSPESAGARAAALLDMYEGDNKISVVGSMASMSAPAPEPEALRKLSARLNAGDEVEREAVEMVLGDLGYIKSKVVMSPGQYSMRGYILDIFPVTSDNPVRVEFFGDEIESMRSFDIESQRSISELDTVAMLAAELPGDATSAMETLGSLDSFYSHRLGEEIPDGARVYSDMSLEQQEGEGISRADCRSFGGLGIMPDERKGVQALPMAVDSLSNDVKLMLVASSRGQAERLRDLMREQDLICPIIPIVEAGSYSGNPFITVGKLSAGLNVDGLVILTELEIFGGRPDYRPIKKSRVSGLLTNMDDLEAGDLVVHEDRGIGKFLGLGHEEVEGIGYDMVLLEYAENSRLHLPIGSIDKIRKYHATEGTVPKLDSMGAKRWTKTRAKVRKRVLELAAKLIRLYAEREVTDGHPFSPDTEVHNEFDSFFPYEATPDQARAALEIKAEMESARPMDRLLCGDVGYGKTEVAMRAAFKAVYDGKQVAVLVPTTLLCEQHLRVFRKRFAAFPMNIEAMNRFKPRKELLATLDNLKKGTVDIVIATHTLLRKNIEFADLGLLIVDEEHRFGVGQKEKIKQLRKGVDVLSMSATPIPRTLQMSMSGIRSMSLIETPPEERQAVKSSVALFTDGLVRDAISREMARGGQVFFVHNRIRDIDRLAQKLNRLVPNARIAMAHGQMKEGELERIMVDFLNGDIDVLLSTAIVGSGIDITNANTIIVDLAHRMGLADLYQLKGRVGRGSTRGYAWFLVPGDSFLTDDARQRLDALQDMSYMGAGFRLAMKDLEIRGAGNMLGPQQSGAIEAVGFDLYMDMLEAAVSELKGETKAVRVKCGINIKANAFIPEDYIEDMSLRLSAYRSVSSAEDIDALTELEQEVADRFGKPPEQYTNLIKVRTLALRAEALCIADISVGGWGVKFSFALGATVQADELMEALSRRMRFLPGDHSGPGGFEVKVKRNPMDTANRVIDALEAKEGLISRNDG